MKKAKKISNFQFLLSKLSHPPVPYETKFSIIMVASGHQERLAHTLHALNQQSYLNFEVIILDSGQYLKTVEVLQDFKTGFSISHYAVNGHKYIAMLNRGIKLSKGRYLFFVDPGESFLYASLFEELLANIFNYREPDLVADRNWKGFFGRKDLSKVKKLPLLSVLVKKDLFTKLGYFNASYPHSFFYQWLSRALSELSPIHILTQQRFFSSQFCDSLSFHAVKEELRLLFAQFGLRGLAYCCLPFSLSLPYTPPILSEASI